MTTGLSRALLSAAGPALDTLTRVFEKNNLQPFSKVLAGAAETSDASQPAPEVKHASAVVKPESEPPAAATPPLAVSLKANPFNPEGGTRQPAAKTSGPPAPATVAPGRPLSAQERVLTALPAMPAYLRSQITDTGLFRFGDMEINPSLVRDLDPYTGNVHFQYSTPGGIAVNPDLNVVDPATVKIVS